MKIIDILIEDEEKKTPYQEVEAELEDKIGKSGRRRPGWEFVNAPSVLNLAVGYYTSTDVSMTAGMAVDLAIEKIHPDMKDKRSDPGSKPSKDSKDKEKTVRSPMTRNKIDFGDDDRISSKTGKKWGNQYYSSDPDRSDVYRNLKQKLGKAIGNVTQKKARSIGSDIAKDAVSAFDKLTKLGKKR